MKVVFWNIKTLNLDVVENLFITENADVFLFCEDGALKKEEINHVVENKGYILIETPGCNRISAFCKKNYTIDLNIQNSFYTTFKISSSTEKTLYIVSLHLNSQMYNSIAELGHFLSRLRNEIELNIGTSLNKEILIMGDFNVNPFDNAIIGFNGFCATNSRKPPKYGKSIQEKKELFVNPTWELYSRKNYPGTKKFPRPSATSFDIIDWHYLDQVIISQKLNDVITSEEIKILENISDYILINDYGKISFSDHLPISYEFLRS